MLHGPLLGKIFVFAMPLIASGILQQSFNAVDVAIVGNYCNAHAIAAVGSNGPEPLLMLCVQYRGNTFTAEDAQDGNILSAPVSW